MTEHKKTGRKPVKTGKDRDERLKAALKANLARRKMQMRARSDDKNPAGDDKG